MTYEQLMISKSCLHCKKANCSKYCPLNMPIPEILDLISDNKEKEAAKLLYNTTPFPFVCGKLCDINRKCKGHCIKKENPIPFNEIEAYLGHKYLNILLSKPKFSLNYKVALIGGGISNLSIALRLINSGIKPTIYEKTGHLGGVITSSLPNFRYDKSDYLKVIKFITKNADIYYNHEFGKNLLFDDLKDYQKVVISTGSCIERTTLNDENVFKAINLLENKKLRSTLKNKDVIVLGGGNVAFDIARTLQKEGSNVTIAYRRDLPNAPSTSEEITNALNEKIKVIEKVSPIKIIKENNMIKGLTFEKMELYDDGSSRLQFKKTGEFIDLKTDIIVEALGSISDYRYLKEIDQNLFDENGWLIVNDKYLTKIPNLYVSGDFLTGPKDFVSAISSAEVISKEIIKDAFKHPFISDKEVVLGGSFNPPTAAHMEMMKILNLFNPKKIILLPNGSHYKLCYQDKKLNNFHIRVELLKELIKDSKLLNCEISQIENDHQFMGTYYTLEELNHPTFVIGSDCLYDFPKWHHYEDLVKNNHIVVFTRNADYEKCIEFMKNDIYLKDNIDHFMFINLDLATISSTNFKSTYNKKMLTKNVYKYINIHNLYEVNNDE